VSASRQARRRAGGLSGFDLEALELGRSLMRLPDTMAQAVLLFVDVVQQMEPECSVCGDPLDELVNVCMQTDATRRKLSFSLEHPVCAGQERIAHGLVEQVEPLAH
jgi:hypothetical protein